MAKVGTVCLRPAPLYRTAQGVLKVRNPLPEQPCYSFYRETTGNRTLMVRGGGGTSPCITAPLRRSPRGTLKPWLPDTAQPTANFAMTIDVTAYYRTTVQRILHDCSGYYTERSVNFGVGTDFYETLGYSLGATNSAARWYLCNYLNYYQQAYSRLLGNPRHAPQLSWLNNPGMRVYTRDCIECIAGLGMTAGWNPQGPYAGIHGAGYPVYGPRQIITSNGTINLRSAWTLAFQLDEFKSPLSLGNTFSNVTTQMDCCEHYNAQDQVWEYGHSETTEWNWATAHAGINLFQAGNTICPQDENDPLSCGGWYDSWPEQWWTTFAQQTPFRGELVENGCGALLVIVGYEDELTLEEMDPNAIPAPDYCVVLVQLDQTRIRDGQVARLGYPNGGSKWYVVSIDNPSATMEAPNAPSQQGIYNWQLDWPGNFRESHLRPFPQPPDHPFCRDYSNFPNEHQDLPDFPRLFVTFKSQYSPTPGGVFDPACNDWAP